jgi:hypothetical protein
MKAYHHLAKEMSFPENEYYSIKERLDSGKVCYTTRVAKEFGKYEVGETYITPFERRIRIESIKKYEKISEHPFYDELTTEQRNEIYQYSEAVNKSYELIAFILC